MEAISLETADNKFLITVDSDVVNKEFIMQMIEGLQREYLAQKINFTEDITTTGETIKEDWWNKNKQRLLGGKP